MAGEPNGVIFLRKEKTAFLQQFMTVATEKNAWNACWNQHWFGTLFAQFANWNKLTSNYFYFKRHYLTSCLSRIWIYGRWLQNWEQFGNNVLLIMGKVPGYMDKYGVVREICLFVCKFHSNSPNNVQQNIKISV